MQGVGRDRNDCRGGCNVTMSLPFLWTRARRLPAMGPADGSGAGGGEAGPGPGSTVPAAERVVSKGGHLPQQGQARWRHLKVQQPEPMSCELPRPSRRAGEDADKGGNVEENAGENGKKAQSLQ
jgi:hypothetical protein